MYAVIARNITSSDPAMWEALARRADTDFIPHLRRAPGLRDYYAVRDEASGVMHIISLWDSEADAKAFGATAEVQAWNRIVQEFGSRNEAAYRGEVLRHVSARE